jgi:sulfur carrier protein ThiS adenylyltransferase
LGTTTEEHPSTKEDDMIENRDIRQREIVPPEKIDGMTATVIGVGAIGRQVALQLAAMGIKKLQFIDPDVVAPENLAAQGFLEGDLDVPKVEAVKQMCEKINSEISIEIVPSLFADDTEHGEVVFCCVDSMMSRRHIWDTIEENIQIMLDTRMSAESMRILAVDTEKGDTYWYDETLFSDEEAHGTRCTAKSTIYCANIAAGLAISEFTKWLREMPVAKDKMLNLLSGEMADMSSSGGFGEEEEEPQNNGGRNGGQNGGNYADDPELQELLREVEES